MNTLETENTAKEDTFLYEVIASHLAFVRERLAKAEKALMDISAFHALGAMDPDKTMQERRDVAWNALERVRRIAREGLR